MVQLVSIAHEVCGAPWLIICCTIALLNVVVALRLVFISRSVVGLVAFMPTIFLPLAIGAIGSAAGLLQAIEMSIDESGGGVKNSTLLLSWALLPLVIGGALCAPAYTIAALGRLWLALRGVPSPKKPSEPTKAELAAQNTAADDAAYQAYADMVTSSGHRRK